MSSNVKRDHHLWTRDTIKNVSGNTTLDIAGDIILDANSGITKFYDAGDDDDYCSLTVDGGTGATTLATTSAGSDGDISLDSSRKIILDAASTASGAGIQLLKAGTKIGAFEAHHGYSALFLYENEGDPGDDVFAIQCFEHGATTIATVDTAAANAHLTLDADGDLILDPNSGITKFYLAGSTTDYASLTVASNGVTTLTTVDDGVGSSGHLTLDVDGDVVLDPYSGITKFYKNGDTDDYLSITVGFGGIATIATTDSDGSAAHLTLDVNGNINLDADTGIFNFYDAGDTDDAFKITVSGGTGSTILETVSAAADGHLLVMADGHVEFKGCGAGFDLVTPVYNASDTDVDFTTGNKQFVTFGSGNIADLNLKFPIVSGNFVLLLKQDGTGSRTVDADGWLAFDSAGNAANGSSTVKFAGGSNPTLTTDANHVDIISFFWDADNEIAYGVASLDFQF